MARCSSRPDHSLERGSEAGAQIMTAMRKTGYSFLGLLAGDAALLALLLWLSGAWDTSLGNHRLLCAFVSFAGMDRDRHSGCAAYGCSIVKKTALGLGDLNRLSTWSARVGPSLVFLASVLRPSSSPEFRCTLGLEFGRVVRDIVGDAGFHSCLCSLQRWHDEHRRQNKRGIPFCMPLYFLPR